MLVCLPQRNALVRMISYQQNKLRPAIPTSLQDIVIEDPYNKTLQGDLFLIYDPGIIDDNRILMFTTLNNIRFLAESDTLFSDGTFKTVPNQFLQLFTIHGIVQQFVFPFVFCLTAKKNEHTYNTMN
mgnify:FL=1